MFVQNLTLTWTMRLPAHPAWGRDLLMVRWSEPRYENANKRVILSPFINPLIQERVIRNTALVWNIQKVCVALSRTSTIPHKLPNRNCFHTLVQSFSTRRNILTQLKPFRRRPSLFPRLRHSQASALHTQKLQKKCYVLSHNPLSYRESAQRSGSSCIDSRHYYFSL